MLIHRTIDSTAIDTFFLSAGAYGIGVHDGLSARIASKYSFDFLWIGSFGVSAAHGFPDAAVIDPCELAQVVRDASRVTHLPVVVDLDSGYGDAGKVYRVVQEMAVAGACAMTIEDNPLSKRSSLYERYTPQLASAQEHAERVRAATCAISDMGSNCRVVARTEALAAGLGVEEALTRAAAYVEAGAAAVFVQSRDRSGRDVLRFLARWERRTPVFLAPTLLQDTSPAELLAAGASHVIFANQAVRAAHRAIDAVAARLADSRDVASVDDLVSSVDSVSATAGAEQLFELERRVVGRTTG